jgi:hypothetical protein
MTLPWSPARRTTSDNPWMPHHCRSNPGEGIADNLGLGCRKIVHNRRKRRGGRPARKKPLKFRHPVANIAKPANDRTALGTVQRSHRLRRLQKNRSDERNTGKRKTPKKNPRGHHPSGTPARRKTSGQESSAAHRGGSRRTPSPLRIISRANRSIVKKSKSWTISNQPFIA